MRGTATLRVALLANKPTRARHGSLSRRGDRERTRTSCHLSRHEMADSNPPAAPGYISWRMAE
jgi:hypothetical protein